jgi:hypothetical protein
MKKSQLEVLFQLGFFIYQSVSIRVYNQGDISDCLLSMREW